VPAHARSSVVAASSAARHSRRGRVAKNRTSAPVVSLLSSTSARIQITPLGSGSRWQIDDLYIDPYISRVG
jgi:hypothetical protein